MKLGDIVVDIKNKLDKERARLMLNELETWLPWLRRKSSTIVNAIANYDGIKEDTYFVTGFVDRTSSTITLSTRTVSVTPTTSTFSFYCAGQKYTKASACTTTIAATAGLHYIYFDTNGVLQNTMTAWDITSGNSPVCTVFWNGSAGAICDERHSAGRNQTWHEWAHDTVGCRYESGLVQTYPTTTNDGITQIEAGVIHDEDIDFTITQQKVIRNFYETAAGTWTFANGTNNGGYDRPYIWNAATSRIQYPKSDSSYTLTDASNTNFIVVWVFATTDLSRPIYIITQAKTAPYTNLPAARLAVQPSTAGLLTPELKLIYRWIFRGDGEYQEGVDYRASSSLPAGGTPATAAIAVTFSPTGDISSTNVQAAITELDTEKAALAHVHDSDDVTYAPTTLTDWDGDADPGDVEQALDQLAERVDDLEGATVDSDDVTYVPTTLTDWDGDADPGDVEQALDQLAERVDDLEGATTVPNHDHSGDAGDGATFDAANLTSSTASDGWVLTADGSGGAAWEASAGGAVDSDDVTYTPTTLTDWDSDTDPGDVEQALDQLAERVDDLEGAASVVEDTAYGSGWDGDTTHSPSQNAVYDKINAMISDTAYDATSWDSVTDVAPSKNAIRDKLETLTLSFPYERWDPDYPPSSATTQDDEFSDSSLDGKWTEFDPNNLLTSSEGDYGLVLTQTTRSGNNVVGLYQTIPSGDFTITTRVSASQMAANYQGSGLALWQNAADTSGDIFTWGYVFGSNLEAAKLTDHNTFSGNVKYGLGASAGGVTYYLRIRRKSTNYYCAWGTDGISWSDSGAHTFGYAPTHFGIFMNNINSGVNIVSTFRFFRYIASDIGAAGVLTGRLA